MRGSEHARDDPVPGAQLFADGREPVGDDSHHLLEPLTGSLGVGVRTRYERRAAIEAMVAVGTSRFNEPFEIDSIRLYFGVNRGL